MSRSYRKKSIASTGLTKQKVYNKQLISRLYRSKSKQYLLIAIRNDLNDYKKFDLYKKEYSFEWRDKYFTICETESEHAQWTFLFNYHYPYEEYLKDYKKRMICK